MNIWLAVQDGDNDCYNIIAPTKKELVNMLKDYNNSRDHEFYVAYLIKTDTRRDTFDLINYITGEGGGRNSHGMGKPVKQYIIQKNYSFTEVSLDKIVSKDYYNKITLLDK